MTGKIVPCVGAIILDKRGRVLLVKHNPEKGGFWANKYICPGGRLEAGESLEEGVRREIKEETGLEINILRWVRPFERVIRDTDGTLQDHVIYLDAIATKQKGQFRPASDVGEGSWFSKEQLKQVRNEIHEDTQILLREAGLLD